MEVSITRFRREIFDLVNQALDGSEVWVTHKGRRLKIAPEINPGDQPIRRLGRITPLEVINPDAPESKAHSLQEEMVRAWERDWVTL